MHMHLILAFLTLAAFLAPPHAPGQSPEELNAPEEFRQDFEEGDISGWESYPPFQDSAFDPDFKCSRENNLPGSHFALSRKVQIGFPTKYEIGFIRRLSLRMTKSSSVSFSYLLKMYGDVTRMDAVVCGKNGKKYTHTISSPVNERWETVNIARPSFMDGKEPLSPGEPIDAFYVLAYVGRTNPDVAYRFYLDDVVITGEAPVQFQVVTPQSTVLEHWNKTVLHTHYNAGSALALSARVPAPAVLSSAVFSLDDPHGRHAVRRAPLSYNGATQTWENTSLYTFSERDAKGRWKGTLEGVDAQNRHVRTIFDVWLTERSQPHPRLYFGAADRDFYKRRMETPKWKAWFDTLAAKSAALRSTSNVGSIVFGAETSSLRVIPPTQWTLQSLAKADVSVYDTTYLLPTISHYYGVMVPAMEILYNHALLYAFRGDREAGEYGKDALLAIANWKTWTHSWFRARHQESYYPVGELGVRAAVCYDAVHDLLTPAERKAVREGLLRNCIIPVYQEYVVQDRIPSSTSNWIGNSVSGALSCILALYGDDPAGGDFEPYLTGLLTKLEEHISSTLDTSGAWGEGIGYQSFAYSNTLPTITALTRVLHTDITSPGILRSYLYFLYNTSRSDIFDVGDSHPTLATLSFFAWILSKKDDPVFRGFYLTSPRDHPLDFLFGREDGRATPPDALPQSTLFTEIGAAVFRSGWSPDDIVMNFRCGPWYNHQHFHQGNFQLAAFGETLVPEAGPAHYYNDPWYPLYYTQAEGHNTVLLDENPGSQRSGDYLHFVRAADDRAAMREFIGTEGYGAATGEMQALYRGDLNLFERTIIFMRPSYFVVFDRLRSSGEPHQYNWILHYDDRKDVEVSGKDMTIAREHAGLLAKVVSPEDAAIDVKGAPVRLGVPITHPGFLEVSNPVRSTGEDFLVVLYPKRLQAHDRQSGGAELRSLSDSVVPLKGKNYKGTQVSRGGALDEILFRTDEGKEEIRNDHVATDGTIVARTVRGDRLEMLAVHNATFVTCAAPEASLQGTAKFTAAGTFTEEGAKWTVQPAAPGKVTFQCPRKPAEVNQDGKVISSYTWNEGRRLLTLPVTQGTATIGIRY